MNLVQLRAAFRRDADDRAEPYLWSDEDISDWLNEAQKEACIRGRLLADSATLSVTKGDAVIVLPDDWFEIYIAALEISPNQQCYLKQYDAIERDRVRPRWRTETRRPDGFIHRDGQIELNAQPNRDYELYIEGFRLPKLMLADGDEPEINPIHHIKLVHWALFKAHSVPDKEMFDPSKAADHEQRFEYYFGRDPKATLRKPQSANNPHHNKCWW